MNKTIYRIKQNQQGITGLETAIILIAFIVVASVFAYTVLSAGLFSSQKTEEVLHTGIEEAESTIKVLGNVLAYKGTASGDECVAKLQMVLGKASGGGSIDLTPFYRIDSNGALVSPVVSDCDTAWTASGSNVAVTTDGADYKEVPASNKLTVAAAFTTGTMAYYNMSTALDMTYAKQMTVWIKSSADQTAGVIRLAVCSGTAGANAVETLDTPALAANVWTEAIVALSNPGAIELSSINSIALIASSDPGTIDIHLDEVRAGTGTDLGRNVTMVAYNDANTYIDDCAWTVEFAGGYGTGTNDYLLENSEKATVTIWLHGFNGTSYSNGSGVDDPFIDTNAEHLKSSAVFNLQIMPPQGATMLVQKRTPAYLHSIMRLL
ncbi:MAG: hypothetical protein HOC20_03665 [Chloroflexi bacterium]|jgi:archaeal flagellin FlaB|nr:hypothetical protein [Chloroflexota bacterium]